jgi:hypothetical protein
VGGSSYITSPWMRILFWLISNIGGVLVRANLIMVDRVLRRVHSDRRFRLTEA